MSSLRMYGEKSKSISDMIKNSKIKVIKKEMQTRVRTRKELWEEDYLVLSYDVIFPNAYFYFLLLTLFFIVF